MKHSLHKLHSRSNYDIIDSGGQPFLFAVSLRVVIHPKKVLVALTWIYKHVIILCSEYGHRRLILWTAAFVVWVQAAGWPRWLHWAGLMAAPHETPLMPTPTVLPQTINFNMAWDDVFWSLVVTLGREASQENHLYAMCLVLNRTTPSFPFWCFSCVLYTWVCSKGSLWWSMNGPGWKGLN